jgi:hypothetical protein
MSWLENSVGSMAGDIGLKPPPSAIILTYHESQYYFWRNVNSDAKVKFCMLVPQSGKNLGGIGSKGEAKR